MLDPQSPFFAVLFVMAFLGFAVVWVMFVSKRVRPWIRQKMAESMGLKIVERYRTRNLSWEIDGPHTSAQGCSVTIGQFFADFGCMVLPIFLALGIMGTTFIALSER